MVAWVMSKTRGLVLSGGGAKGAWQVGALQRLVEGDAAYGVVTGTSVGALNAAALAQYRVGEEAKAVAGLRALWLGIRGNRSIYKRWWWGLLGRLPVVLPSWLGGKTSMYSTDPLWNLIVKNLDPIAVLASGRELRVGAVDLITGSSHQWDQGDVFELRHAVLASAAVPVAFPPVPIGYGLYTDDGVREVTPVESAILAGATEIDVLMCSPSTPEPSRPRTGVDVGIRSLEAAIFEIEYWDLKVVELYNRLAKTGSAPDKAEIKVRVLRPKSSLGDPLDFSPSSIRTNMKRGYSDAVDAGW